MEDHDGEGAVVTCRGDGEHPWGPAWGQEEQLCQHLLSKLNSGRRSPAGANTHCKRLCIKPQVWSVAQHKHLLSSSTEEASWKGDTQHMALTGTEEATALVTATYSSATPSPGATRAQQKQTSCE